MLVTIARAAEMLSGVARLVELTPEVAVWPNVVDIVLARRGVEALFRIMSSWILELF